MGGRRQEVLPSMLLVDFHMFHCRHFISQGVQNQINNVHKINLHMMEERLIVYSVFYHWNKIYFAFAHKTLQIVFF